MMKPVEERIQDAKAYRKSTSRSSLGAWEPQMNRPIVKQLLLEQEETRQKELIPIRRERMSVSPFTFFRGAAVIQAHDIASTPGTPFRVQACGDAHMSNFGIFASPERRLVFDINDFDETLPAPFEVDVKRLIASIEICGRCRGFTGEQSASAVHDAAAAYRQAMREYSDMGNLDVWYHHVDVEDLVEENADSMNKQQAKKVEEMREKVLAKNSDRAVRKLTETVDGRLRIKSDPPLIVPIREMLDSEKMLYDFKDIMKAIELYKESLPAERRGLIDQYQPIELAHKVVGVGSVGRKAWILIMMGRDNGDPLVLQIKEAEQSVLEKYYGASAYAECGRRVVEGQRAIQTAGDILLGWLRLNFQNGSRHDYYVRQLWDAKGSFDLDAISFEGYHKLSMLCARTLAHAHAKTGDRHAIAAYLGKGEVFERAMARYAIAYADQNEADYEEFMKFNAGY
ncbi:MAG: DUF2252 domain-containing protein [Lachnospiraceae bacterium]|nr:DUF2252 domain-containing protein [Lachnospiraceae bacterium]